MIEDLGIRRRPVEFVPGRRQSFYDQPRVCEPVVDERIVIRVRGGADYECGVTLTKHCGKGNQGLDDRVVVSGCDRIAIVASNEQNTQN
jgi:hypothetical protein